MNTTAMIKAISGLSFDELVTLFDSCKVPISRSTLSYRTKSDADSFSGSSQEERFVKNLITSESLDAEQFVENIKNFYLYTRRLITMMYGITGDTMIKQLLHNDLGADYSMDDDLAFDSVDDLEVENDSLDDLDDFNELNDDMSDFDDEFEDSDFDDVSEVDEVIDEFDDDDFLDDLDSDIDDELLNDDLDSSDFEDDDLESGDEDDELDSGDEDDDLFDNMFDDVKLGVSEDELPDFDDGSEPWDGLGELSKSKRKKTALLSDNFESNIDLEDEFDSDEARI